jgi:hypothetical protein
MATDFARSKFSTGLGVNAAMWSPFVGSIFYVIDAEWRKGNKRVPVAGDRKMVHLERRESTKSSKIS